MPKLKNLTIQNDPMERLTVNLHASVVEKLTLYKLFYEKSLGGKLQLNSIVEEMLKTVMDEDKDFKAFVKEHEDTKASVVAAKPAAATRAAEASSSNAVNAGAAGISAAEAN